MYDLSLLSIKGWVLDRCRALDRLVSVDAHLWLEATSQKVEKGSLADLLEDTSLQVPDYR